MAIPTGFPDMVETTTTSILGVVADVANTIVTTFPLNLALGVMIIGIGVALYRKFKH